MSESVVYKHIISTLYKMLCWREERKNWLTIYEELIAEITFNTYIPEDVRATLVLKITILKYIDFLKFRQNIFEVINYVDEIRRISEPLSL